MACTVRWIQNLVVEHREVKSQAKSMSLREKDEREREKESEREGEREREMWKKVGIITIMLKSRKTKWDRVRDRKEMRKKGGKKV